MPGAQEQGVHGVSATLTRSIALTVAAFALPAVAAPEFNPATAFGARPSVSDLSLSPDGKTVAYIIPTTGQGSALFTLRLEKGATRKNVTSVDGKPERLRDCAWVANDRLVCTVYGVVPDPALGLVQKSRLIAIDADGSNLKLLSTKENSYSRGWQLGGGEIIDWLPDENGAVLMARVYLPDDRTGSHLGSSEHGLGVDRVDTRTLQVSHVVPPKADAVDYITDGRGAVRIMGASQVHDDRDTGLITYSYRDAGARDWKKLSEFNSVTGEGFEPLAVDHDLNVA